MTGAGSREPGAGLTPEQQHPPSLATTQAGSGEVSPKRPSAAQADAAEEFRKLRGVDPFGPFIQLLESPELMTRVSALGEYLRFRSALPPRLSELAILITAAHWKQTYEWEIHAPVALKSGIPQSVLDEVWAGQRPSLLADDQSALYDVCVALHRERAAAGEVVARAERVLGKQATIDAIAICGYYALLAMVLNSK